MHPCESEIFNVEAVECGEPANKLLHLYQPDGEFVMSLWLCDDHYNDPEIRELMEDNFKVEY